MRVSIKRRFDNFKVMLADLNYAMPEYLAFCFYDFFLMDLSQSYDVIDRNMMSTKHVKVIYGNLRGSKI